MKIFTMVSVFFLSFTITAKAEVKNIQYFWDEESRFAVVYPEGQHHFLDIYILDASGWQKHLSQEVFANDVDLRVAIKREGLLSTTQNRLVRFAARAIEKNKTVILTGDMIWPTENQWNWDWELKYATWVKENVDEDFFRKNRIATDCADVAISSRWIFSRMHHLPMANSLAGTDRLFSNEVVSQKFSQLPTAPDWRQDSRFLAALDYVLDNTYTHSLMADSYPVSIDPATFLPGIHHLNLYLEDSGHTMLVNDVNAATGGVSLIYSDVPRQVRELYSDTFNEYEQYPNLTRGGFLRIRWAISTSTGLQLKSRQSMPHYSLMQYEPSFVQGVDAFSDAVEAHLGLNVTKQDRVLLGTQNLAAKIRARVNIVETGYSLCQRQDCSMGTVNYENWSTHSRDRKILNQIYYVLDFVDDEETNFVWSTFLSTNQIQVQRKTIFYHEMINKFINELTSPDPRRTRLQRWGF